MEDQTQEVTSKETQTDYRIERLQKEVNQLENKMRVLEKYLEININNNWRAEKKI